jgi:hypothetical protein
MKNITTGLWKSFWKNPEFKFNGYLTEMYVS